MAILYDDPLVQGRATADSARGPRTYRITGDAVTVREILFPHAKRPEGAVSLLADRIKKITPSRDVCERDIV